MYIEIILEIGVFHFSSQDSRQEGACQDSEVILYCLTFSGDRGKGSLPGQDSLVDGAVGYCQRFSTG